MLNDASVSAPSAATGSAPEFSLVGVAIVPCLTAPVAAEPDTIPPTTPCGTQRPGINIAPAIAPDGTIYTITRLRSSRS